MTCAHCRRRRWQRHAKPPRAYHDLNVASMALYLELGDEFQDTSWFRVTGNAEWTKTDAARQEQKERIARLRSWGYRAQWIDLDDLVDLEPDLSRDAVGDAQNYLCVTHSGVTLAPVLGKLMAEEVVHGRTTIDVGPFRPTRFAAHSGG